MTNSTSIASALSYALRVQPSGTRLFGTHAPGKKNTYQWTTYQEVADASAALSSGLQSLHISRRSCVAISANNCPEWMVTDFACAFGDFMSVGVHPSWPVSKIQAVLHDTEARVVVVSLETLQATRQILESDESFGEMLIVVLGGITEDLPSPLTAAAAAAAAKGSLSSSPSARVTYVSYMDVLALGHAHPCTTHTGYGFADDADNLDLENDDTKPFTLMYSSGTSGGPPKATATPKSMWMDSNCMPGPFAQFSIWERRAVSYLSLSHGADRGVAWQCVFSGGEVGFASCGEENLNSLLQDMEVLRPTFLLGMANFWTAIYARHRRRLDADVDERLLRSLLDGDDEKKEEKEKKEKKEKKEEEEDQKKKGEDQKALIHAIMSFKHQHPEAWDQLRTSLLETRVGGALRVDLLNNARAEMGSCLLMVATGGSSTPKLVREFMASMLTEGNATRVKDAYGLTEFPGISTNGEISENVELRLGPVERDGKLVYNPNDPDHPRGEIIVRRKKKKLLTMKSKIKKNSNQYVVPRISHWKRPDLDEKKFDQEGWYYTGDVGELDYCNRIIPNQYHLQRSVLGHEQWRGAPPLLRVIDRVKSLEEIYWKGDSQWISVAALEGQYSAKTSKWIRHVILVSDRNESGVIAICLLTAAGEMEMSSGPLLSMLQTIGHESKMKPYEIPLGVVVVPPSKQSDLVTITGKPLRSLIKANYHQEWMDAYQAAAVAASAPPLPAAAAAAPPPPLSTPPPTTTTTTPTPTTESAQLSQRCLHAVSSLASSLESISASETGIKKEGIRPLPIKRGHRMVDVRIRLYSPTKKKMMNDDDIDYEQLQCLPAKLSDKTVRGRDWLEDMLHDGNSTAAALEKEVQKAGEEKVGGVEDEGEEQPTMNLRERRFEFFMVRSSDEEEWRPLERRERVRLNQCLEKLRAAALVIRRNIKAWTEDFQHESAELAKRRKVVEETWRRHVEKKVREMRERGKRKQREQRKHSRARSAAVAVWTLPSPPRVALFSS